MPKKIGEIIRLLEVNGFVLKRTRGSHRTFKSKEFPHIIQIIAGNPGKDAQIYLEKEVATKIRKVSNLKKERNLIKTREKQTPTRER